MTVAIDPSDETEEVVEASTSYFLKEAKSPFTLPYGFFGYDGKLHREVELEPMTGIEEDLLLKEADVRSGKAYRQVIANCITRIGELTYGPMDQRDVKAKTRAFKDVGRMTLSDRAFLLMCLRRISLLDGDVYKFPLACATDGCDEFINVLSLSTDIPIYPVADPKQEYEVRLPNGKTVRYRHLTVDDEPRIGELTKLYKDGLASAYLWAHILSADGQVVKSHRDVQRWSTRDREQLRADIDAHDGGVDLSYTARCPVCSRTQRGRLEVDIAFFMQSREDIKRRSMAGRSSSRS
jgi:hypothetical protein